MPRLCRRGVIFQEIPNEGEGREPNDRQHGRRRLPAVLESDGHASHIAMGTRLPDTLESALERTRDWLLDRQDADGYWVAELEGDTILESEYILLMTFLGRESDDVCIRCARYIQDHQLPDGGWAIYPGGPTDVSASVKAYFALKLTGRSPDEPAMAMARRAILEAGGAHECNSFTRFYLALLGQIGYEECPCVPPELVLIPSRWKLQPERDVGLDADDRRAAVDHVVFQAGPGAWGPSRVSRSCSAKAGDGRRVGRPGCSPGRTSSSGWTWS